MFTPFPVSQRKRLMLFLVSAFVIQTYLVYSDPQGRNIPPLSELARQGQTLWWKNNCQSCHQIYGFGGFLGPDLTNAARILTRPRLNFVLTQGSPQMPAFDFSSAEIDGLEAFFRELDRTGVSQPNTVAFEDRVGSLDPVNFFDSVVDELQRAHPLSPEAAVGRDFVRQNRCLTCHLPYRKSLYNAPDLSLVIQRLSPSAILQTVREGRLTRGMLSFTIFPEEKESLIAYLTWLNAHHEEVTQKMAQFVRPPFHFREPIPWFEYHP